MVLIMKDVAKVWNPDMTPDFLRCYLDIRISSLVRLVLIHTKFTRFLIGSA